MLTRWRDAGHSFGLIVGDLGYGGLTDIDNVRSGPASVPGAPLVLYAMGNHETDGVGKRAWIDGLYPGAVRTTSWTPMSSIAAGNADHVYYSFDIGPYTHFVVLDGDHVTFDGVDARVRQRFGQTQLAWLAADVAANPDKNVLVFVHEPIDQQLTGSVPEYTLNDKGALIDVLAAHPKQTFVFSGHFHGLSGITRWRGVTSVHVMNGAGALSGVGVTVSGDQVAITGGGVVTDFDQHPMNQVSTSGGAQVITVAEDGANAGNTRNAKMVATAAERGVVPTSGTLMLKAESMTWYAPRFISEQLVKIRPGMRLSFDMSLLDVVGGADAVTVQPNWYMRDGSLPPRVVDQNGIQLSQRPRDAMYFMYNEDVPTLGGRATGTWYHREFDLSALAGNYIDGFYLTSGGGRVNVGAIYVDNIRLTWPASAPPPAGSGTETVLTTQVPVVIGSGSFELGLRVASDVPGQITGVRYWKPAGETGVHVGRIWNAAGQLVASVAFTNETASGWQQQALPTPVTIAANTEYVTSVNANSLWAATVGTFASTLVNGHLRAPAPANGLYASSGTFPTLSWQSSNYFRDVMFVAQSSTSPPTVAGESLLTTQVPGGAASGIFELGVRLVSDIGGQFSALRFWKAAGETGVHTGRVWTASGQLLASVVFQNETASGWQQQPLPVPVTVVAGTEYVVSVNSNGLWAGSVGAFALPLVNGHLRTAAGGNGVYGTPGGFPASTWQGTNYFRDVVFVR